MARGIATRALAGGHTVTLLGTDQEKAQALASELAGDVRAGTVGDPLSGDVVVLAVWYQALDDVLGRYGDQLAGRTVVDITNPVDPQTYAPLIVEAGSAAQEIAAKAPGAKVVKAFNTTFAGSLVEGQVAASRSTSSSPPTTRRQGEGPRARRERRPARPRRRSARERPPARGRRLPAHGDPAGHRRHLRQRPEDRLLASACRAPRSRQRSGARPCIRSRYADGASPNRRLNAREKYSWSP